MSNMNYGSANAPLDADETHYLISASKVDGTDVYDESGEKVGSVDSIMINKLTGQVAYAVMSFGGFLGIGERYHPLPWDVLTYDTSLGGYRVNQPASALKDAPHYSREEIDRHDYAKSGSTVDTWYGSLGTGQSPL